MPPPKVIAVLHKDLKNLQNLHLNDCSQLPADAINELRQQLAQTKIIGP
jgi:hypothetical protein